MKKILAAALVMTLTAGCFGTMNATTRLKTWNREKENRWAGQGIFLLLRVPYGGVYGLVFLSDVLYFNAFEFWGGNNPVDPVDSARLQALRAADAERAENR